MEIERVSSRQIILLITISRVVTVLNFMPTIQMPPANQDIWLMIIVSIFYTILMRIPILFLANRFNDLTMVGYMEKIFGRFIGKFIGILYGIHLMRSIVLFIYRPIQMVESSILPESSSILIISIMIITCIYIASKGLEVIGRAADIFVPIILVVTIGFVLLGYKNVDLTILLPIYIDSTFLSINYGAIQMSLIFLEASILMMIIPDLENKKDINKILISSIIYSALIIIMTVVVTQSSLGIEQAKHSNFPFLTYTRLISTFDIIERIESIYVVVWLIANIGRISIYIYITSRIFKEVFNKKESNIFIYLVGIISGLISIYISVRSQMISERLPSSGLEMILYAMFILIIPLMTVIIYLFRRKTFEKQEKLKD